MNGNLFFFMLKAQLVSLCETSFPENEMAAIGRLKGIIAMI